MSIEEYVAVTGHKLELARGDNAKQKTRISDSNVADIDIIYCSLDELEEDGQHDLNILSEHFLKNWNGRRHFDCHKLYSSVLRYESEKGSDVFNCSFSDAEEQLEERHQMDTFINELVNSL